MLRHTNMCLAVTGPILINCCVHSARFVTSAVTANRIASTHLRHSYGTWLAEADVPLLTIRDLMGHKRIETTMLYAKVTDSARNDAVARI